MNNTYRLEKVDHEAFTDEDWKRYYDFRVKSYELKKEPMPFDSWEKLKEINFKSLKERKEMTYMVWKNGVEHNIFYFSIMFKDDLEKRLAYLNNRMNDQHVEAKLLDMIFQKFIEYDESSTALAVHSKEGINDYVEDAYGAHIGSISEFFELKIKEANVEKIDAWLGEAPAKFPNLRIAFYINIPDDLLEEYAAAFTQLLHDMPASSELGELKVTPEDVKARQESGALNNSCAYRYLIFNEDNKLIAKTNVALNRKRPQSMYQFMTGVMEDYRGRGLSKWLKAAMFKKLVADFPELETIKTETHPENHPSRELSKQMGYKKLGSQKEYLIDRSRIIQYLNGNA